MEVATKHDLHRLEFLINPVLPRTRLNRKFSPCNNRQSKETSLVVCGRTEDASLSVHNYHVFRDPPFAAQTLDLVQKAVPLVRRKDVFELDVLEHDHPIFGPPGDFAQVPDENNEV